MSTDYTFTSGQDEPMTINTTIDNEQCTIVLWWNLAGARTWLNLINASGAMIVSKPLAQGINVLAGWAATTTMTYDGITVRIG